MAETKKCVSWIIEKFKEENVDWVVFCGDLFNSRYSINVNTLNIGIEIIQDLAFNFEKVILIEGNHDTYYKNSNSVNSISFMSNISQNDNIVIVDEAPKYAKTGSKTLGFYPWGFEPSSAEEPVPDFGFGHFELNGIEQNGGISSGCKYNLEDMFSLGKTLFSGHYHKPGIYKNLKAKSFLMMVGSPLQLNWGDYGQQKRIITLDLAAGKMKNHYNEVCLKFEKVYYSKMKDESYNDAELKKLCSGNAVKFVIDLQYNFEEVMKFNDRIKECSPMSIEFEYLISLADGVDEAAAEKMGSAKSKLNNEYLEEYIDAIFPEYKKNDDGLKEDVLKKMALSYFEKALLSKEEREGLELEDER